MQSSEFLDSEQVQDFEFNVVTLKTLADLGDKKCGKLNAASELFSIDYYSP